MAEGKRTGESSSNPRVLEMVPAVIKPGRSGARSSGAWSEYVAEALNVS